MRSNDEGQFIQADWKALLVLTGYVVLMLLITLFFTYGFDRVTPPEGASEKQIGQSVESLRQLINMLLVFTLVHAAFFCWYFVRLAKRSLRAEQFPPPETWVIVKTRIRSGKRARWSAYITYCLAVLIWITVAVPIYLKWLLENLI